MSDAFLLYPPSKRMLAVRLWDDLRWHGLDVGIDLQDIPLHLDRTAVMEDIISQCKLVMVMICEEDNSEVRRMHLLAIEQDVCVVPLILPGASLPKTLRAQKAVYFANYPRALRRLLQTLPEDFINRRPDPKRILENLRSDVVEVRRTTLFQVGKDRVHVATSATTCLLLNDSEPEVRAAAAWALDRLGNIECAPSLMIALSDPSFDVRSNAGWALVNMGRRRDSPASRVVITRVIDVLKDSHNADEREMAYLVLSRLGGKRAYDAIERYWHNYR